MSGREDGPCRQGVWHLANAGEVTWFAFAGLIAERLGYSTSLVQRCRTSDCWTPAVRPPYSVLHSVRGAVMRRLDAAIDAYAVELDDAYVAAAR